MEVLQGCDAGINCDLILKHDFIKINDQFSDSKNRDIFNRNSSLFNPHPYFAKFITNPESLKYKTRSFARMG